MKLRFLLPLLLACACRKPIKVESKAEAMPPPTVRVLAAGQDHPWGIYVDATHVYWTNKGSKTPGSIARVEKKEGAAIEPLAEALNVPYGIAVANGRVYWSLSKPALGGLGSMSLVDRTHVDPTRRFEGSIEEPWAILVRGDRLFFNDLHARKIASVGLNASIDVSQITVLANTDSAPVGLAVDETHVYWTDSVPGVIAKTPIEGGPITTLVARGDKTTGLAVDATHAYWSEWGSGRIGKVLKNGGGIAILATEQRGARSIAVDDDRVYWVHPPSSTIRSIGKNGGAIVTHATGQKHPYALAVDATSIYWANVEGGEVASIEKRLP